MSDLSGYRRLAAHVLLRAFQDSTLSFSEQSDTRLGPGRHLHRPGNVTARHQDSSMAFLQSRGQMIRLWCAWLNLSVDDLHDRWKASLPPQPKA